MRKFVVLLAVSLGLVAAAPALAQTYPGSTTTTTPAPTSLTITVTFANGTVTTQICGYAANTSVTFSLNGGATFLTQATDSNGCVTVTIAVITTGSALRAPKAVFAAVGLHRQLLAATNSTVTINGVSLTARPPGQQNDIAIVGTGANGATRTTHVLFTVPAPGGALTRTGVMIKRWTLVALGLVAIGSLLVFADRRRSRRPGVR